jgi:serine/threonine-protein kinase
LIVSEWIEGTSVARWLRFQTSERTVPWQLGVAIAVEVLRGLVGPHACDPPLCHEGLGVHSVRIATDGTVKLIRFGVASALAVRGTAHRRLEELGVRTPSPELLGGGAATVASDIFAVGALLYEMIAGQPPFDAPIGDERDAQIAAAEPPDLSVLREDVPPLLVSLIERALRREPIARFDSATTMIRALTQLLRTEMEPSSPEAVAASVHASLSPRIALPTGIPDQSTIHVEIEELTVMPTIVVGDAREAQLIEEPDSVEGRGIPDQSSEAEPLPLTRPSTENVAQMQRIAGLMPQKTEYLDDELVDRLTVPENIGLKAQRTEVLDSDQVDRLTLPDSKKPR